MNKFLLSEELDAIIEDFIKNARPFMAIDMNARLMNERARQLAQQGGVIRLKLPKRYEPLGTE